MKMQQAKRRAYTIGYERMTKAQFDAIDRHQDEVVVALAKLRFALKAAGVPKAPGADEMLTLADEALQGWIDAEEAQQ